MFKYWTVLVIWAFGTLTWCLYPYRFVGEDQLFYLVVARNLALHGQQTFSGIFPTNGVHPLWQYLLAGYTYLCVAINPAIIRPSHINYAAPLSSALALCGGLSLARFAALAKLPRLLVAERPAVGADGPRRALLRGAPLLCAARLAGRGDAGPSAG